MTSTKVQKYNLKAEWSLSQISTSLLVSGGADARYEIELESDEMSFFATLKSDQTFTRSDLSLSDQRVLEELATAEVVVPILSGNKSLKVAVAGDANNLKIVAQEKNNNADLLIIVRTDNTYAELLEKIDYLSLKKPHLFIDMAFHHTLSIGPLVFPGETACIACLQGRVSNRWGDEKPPMQPRVSKEYGGVVEELLKTELNRIKDGDTGLTNKTVSWNFQDRVVKTSQLLKVPICPVCTQNKIDQGGALALPWEKP